MEPTYHGDVLIELRKALADDPREPKEWSDGDKLRLLAALFDEADLKRGSTEYEVQDDLRRMAKRLDSLDA